MQVRVRAFARLREAIGGDRTVEVPDGATMGTLIAILGAESTGAKSALFAESGQLKAHVILMKNGKRVSRTEIGTLTLADGDEVALFPPVAGG
jgi:molybdopterin synthase sulfur carrier subunit